MRSGERPGDMPAPAVADDDAVAFAERADQAGDVGGLSERVVPAGRFVAGGVAAQIRGDDAESRRSQVDELMPPRPPELRKAVQQHHERTGAELGDVQPDPVRADVVMLPRAVKKGCRLLDRSA